MTRYSPLWQQNASYPASVDRTLINALWPASGNSGGVVTTISNQMNVSVSPGTAAVLLSASVNLSMLCRWDAAEVVAVNTAPPSGNSRIDLIVLQVRDAAIDLGANNDFIFQAIAGTPTTGTPVAPAVPTNAYVIAQLTVPGGAANLNGVAITDLRAGLGRAVASAALKVYSTVNQNLTGAQDVISYQQVLFNTFTDGSVFTLSPGRFTVATTGLYTIMANTLLLWPDSASGGQAITGISVNGGEYLRGTQVLILPHAAGNPGVSAITKARLNRGDLVQIFCQSTMGGVITFAAAPAYVNLAISLDSL
jgi:hypothetical protein